jgi:flagellar biosynthesis/type III secretory pathway chaperone
MDSEAIDAAGAAKLKQLGELEALEHDRAALLDMQAINPDDLTGLEAQGDLQSRWQELLKLLARCRSLNETNGALAASQRRHVEKALGLLYGTSAGAGTYNADGMAKSPAPSASIATA